MIVPMKKASLVVMDKEKTLALDKLQELGVLHLERKQAQSDALTRLLEKKTRTETALALLTHKAERLKKKKLPPTEQLDGDPVESVLALDAEKKNIQEELVLLMRDRTRIEKWGNFDPAAFAAFAEQGFILIPYELTHEAYSNVGDDVKLIVLEKTKTTVRVIAWGAEIAGEPPFAPPEYSLAELDSLIEKCRKKLSDVEEKITSWIPSIERITVARADILERIEYETANASMEILKEDKDAGEDFEGRTVSWISGYIPTEKLGALKRSASGNGWALIVADPDPDDQVPTLLKNNRLVRLLEPLTDFLEITPGYNEIDVSPYFFVFFIIFFGMIFGDAGYGLLLLFAGFTGLVMTARKGVPRAIKLLLLLGSSNFMWGVLTCSWFGIGDMDMLPAILRNVSLPLISNVRAAESAYDDHIVRQNLMIFCFSLALLHLSIGHILAIIHKKTLQSLGHIGSILMLTGMYFIIISLIASNEARHIPLLPCAVPIFAAGFMLNFIFASYDGSVGRSILDSFKNIISVFLGIANVFSDIMSYIRLWAVGLAGAAIAYTVDVIAGPMLGQFMFFVFGVIVLIFGHGLNLMLNMLSVLVHGVRLNTLEFSGHAGLEWSGFAYKPFAKQIEDRAYDTRT